MHHWNRARVLCETKIPDKNKNQNHRTKAGHEHQSFWPADVPVAFMPAGEVYVREHNLFFQKPARPASLGTVGTLHKADLAETFTRISDYWNPRIIGELNGQHVKAVKLKGEFVWHHHEKEDELFLVTKGWLTMRLRDREIVIGPGEFLIVPRGVEHQPYAPEEVHVVLFEPASTLNTGNVKNERTVETLERL